MHEGGMIGPEDAPLLLACFQSSEGEIAPELKAEIAKSASGMNAVLLAALTDPDPYVRKTARGMMGKGRMTLEVPRDEQTRPHTAAVAIPEKNGVEGFANARVEVKTNRGTMVFELFPSEAPNHVRNFVELAARHHYDGLTFHRVELDFVIQGGDHRGDGNGGVTWNDTPLRAEFTPRKFVRGSLGMPRNDDPDSGGSQFFVTHRDTPHLDGRYTNFGLLVSGFDTLDAIEVGDTIESVRVVPAQ
jgi:peptidyl-prolyl cis-trans isomerase B (cyclophilin B)